MKALTLTHADSPPGRVTASIGVHGAVPDHAADDGRAFVVRADAALYGAKAEGRNRTAG